MSLTVLSRSYNLQVSEEEEVLGPILNFASGLHSSPFWYLKLHMFCSKSQPQPHSTRPGAGSAVPAWILVPRGHLSLLPVFTQPDLAPDSFPLPSFLQAIFMLS